LRKLEKIWGCDEGEKRGEKEERGGAGRREEAGERWFFIRSKIWGQKYGTA
jgi:hypothetical protein